MFGPATTVARYVKGHDIFHLWAEDFSLAGHGKAMEVFVDEGVGGGAALFIYDGKEYWSPVYDQTDAAHDQFIRVNNRDPRWDEPTGDYLDVVELDPDEWAVYAFEYLSGIDTEYINYGTTVPRIY